MVVDMITSRQIDPSFPRTSQLVSAAARRQSDRLGECARAVGTGRGRSPDEHLDGGV
jgi:hypothetical protein